MTFAPSGYLRRYLQIPPKEFGPTPLPKVLHAEA